MTKFIRQLGWSVLLFTLVFAILLTCTSRAIVAVPNLDGDYSHPDRVQLYQCFADLKEEVGSESVQSAHDICDFRKAHAKEKARFLVALEKLNDRYKDYTNHGFSHHLPMAIADAWTIVKSCIDFNEGFTALHNVGILIAPEDVRSSCYKLGSGLVELHSN